MSIKDNLLHLIGLDQDNQGNAETDFQNQFPAHFTNGLCIICENKGHCVWVENKKIHCEHYE